MNRQTVLHLTGYTALFILFTLLFIPLNYPSERLTYQVNGWISGVSKGALTVERARIRPPLSVIVEGISLSTDEGPLGLGDAVVKPRFLGFLSGNTGVAARIDNPWLRSRLKLVSSGGGWSLDVRSMEVELSRLPEEIMVLPVNMEGTIGGSLEVVSDDPARGISAGEGRIASGPVEIGGPLLETLGFAPLRISRLSAVVTVEDNVVTLGENALEGDLTATGRGMVRISPNDYANSRMDLTFELKPGPGNRERLMPIFTLLGARPKPDGTVNVRIRGTVGKPSITM